MLNATTTAGAQLRNLVIIVICIALLAGINVVFNDYIVRVISTIFIFMILAVSYNLINGVTGQLSLEPNGFVAVGAAVPQVGVSAVGHTVESARRDGRSGRVASKLPTPCGSHGRCSLLRFGTRLLPMPKKPPAHHPAPSPDRRRGCIAHEGHCCRMCLCVARPRSR